MQSQRGDAGVGEPQHGPGVDGDAGELARNRSERAAVADERDALAVLVGRAQFIYQDTDARPDIDVGLAARR